MKNGGLTLVELLVVMALLGIVAAVAAPLLLGARERSRTATCDQAFHALDGEIANELDLLSRSGDGEPSCGDMGSNFPDLEIIRCLTKLHGDEENPRDPGQALYFNYVEDPLPYDSCQIGLDEDVASVGLAIKLRQFTALDGVERTFVITID